MKMKKIFLQFSDGTQDTFKAYFDFDGRELISYDELVLEPKIIEFLLKWGYDGGDNKLWTEIEMMEVF